MRVVHLVDEVRERTERVVILRLPWLLLGLLGGMTATVMISRFETVLTNNIHLAFFVPIIVYMSDAVGTQTETMYVRSLAREKVDFFNYLKKELLSGIFLGLLMGGLIGGATWLWLRLPETAVTVGLAMMINVTLAPVVAMGVSELLRKSRVDPALGAGPFATVIQDFISLLIYFVVASVIMLI
ncbi:MAG: CBS domain containing protein [Candidatus Amesbacteria bacterium GW2011_GWA1_47_16]|uniref:CBS domain containing protein n=4 Tax=Candidatus Amesiibacteriota TaxID=1752730 RepID=A0A0G1S446_9BACT|nr:MAG: CBS domain containing protein [Candidatus Amesbacteria bacterium GW2011_GWC1_47_15]KKU64256.1 MAG: CBS domain containing protein [Candidatus Amesbacteria bacterium GW2011_GWA1_47_16]KKU98132.1 MAG: CBS domain containing protein [Candidatus Amesbacteria bacterium GW2011_GWB1_48_13]OGC97977.1 MAG: hypothetical protein A2701_02915 [Candidatus Amesbacteria bacterium RIFCSPHIGHO2_01_FULL_47_34]OGC99958.1 MAG: hypothetical protein A2972_03800 [Candidatus Amesbacteria bacterium RIFCSPLOWO2_01_